MTGKIESENDAIRVAGVVVVAVAVVVDIVKVRPVVGRPQPPVVGGRVNKETKHKQKTTYKIIISLHQIEW